MKAKVQVAPQVADFVRSLAPVPRRALDLAIKGLAEGKGDTKSLEGDLVGFTRLRVSGFRVIYREFYEGGQRVADCVFAEKRSIVYELFLSLQAEES